MPSPGRRKVAHILLRLTIRRPRRRARRAAALEGQLPNGAAGAQRPGGRGGGGAERVRAAPVRALRQRLQLRMQQSQWVALQDALTKARNALCVADAPQRVQQRHYYASGQELDAHLDQIVTEPGRADEALQRMLQAEFR